MMNVSKYLCSTSLYMTKRQLPHTLPGSVCENESIHGHLLTQYCGQQSSGYCRARTTHTHNKLLRITLSLLSSAICEYQKALTRGRTDTLATFSSSYYEPKIMALTLELNLTKILRRRTMPNILIKVHLVLKLKLFGRTDMHRYTHTQNRLLYQNHYNGR